ncbi:hypothetical protein FOWG_16887 [Fusarium oxysporum f. sp. lycopersici MN25]|nr:hypothetical protein FOWG_16887 [Fusarium oxysporum f. sp. lycopersici MN25]
MATRIEITVLDANNIPVDGAEITLDGKPITQTDQDGVSTLSANDSNTNNSLVISHTRHITENVRFRGGISTGEWDNALVSRNTVPGRILLRVQLGRLDVAPTELRSNEDIQAILVSHRNLEAALLFNLPRDGRCQAYRFQWNDPLPVEVAEEKILPVNAPTPDLKGWRRFRSTPVNPPADPMALGRFFWALYPGQPKGDQYAVAIWSPNINHEGPLDLLDMVVFFSPHTASYVARYPFGLVPKSDPADQQYMTLGKKYLLDEYGFAYNLIARRRQAVMVMPICKHGNWGPFSSGEGVFRLCREVALFLHRECRTSNLSVTGIGGIGRELRLAGASLRSQGVGIWSRAFGEPSNLGRIVIGGFSSGIAPVKSIMGNWRAQGFTQRDWGCPTWRGISDSQQAFEVAWTELWDLDGSHEGTGGWKNYLNALDRWVYRDSLRMMRLFHSLDQPDPKQHNHPLWKKIFSEGPIYEQYGIPHARELQGKRWTVVHVDSVYIGNNPPVGVPPLGDAHHATPKVAFSHFAALSPVGKRPGTP